MFESFKNLFNNNFFRYGNISIILGFSLTIIFLSSYLYIIFKVVPVPQYTSVTNVLSVLIGSSLTGSISLAIYEKNLKNERNKLISAIRIINANNSALSTVLIIALDDEINLIDANSNYNDFKLPLPNLLRITDIIVQDIALILEKESKKVPEIAIKIDYLIKGLDYREKLIFSNNTKPLAIKQQDEYLVNELKALQKSIKDYEEEIFGSQILIDLNLSTYK